MIIKSAIFDLDGTIIDTSLGIINSMKYAMDKTGLLVDISNPGLFIGPPLYDKLRDLSDMTDEQIAGFIDVFREYNNTEGYKQGRPYPGIFELFKKLRAKGIGVYIATSKPETTANMVAEHFKFNHLIDLLAGASVDKSRIRKSAVLEYLMSKCDIDRHTACMIGDRKYDLMGAREARVHSIGVSYGFAQPGELEEFSPLAICKDTFELGEYLLGE